MKTELFRIRISDGHISPCTSVTNAHGVDKTQVLVPYAVGVAIMRKQVKWRDAVRCVAAGKDPSILLTKPDAVKPRQELEDAPDFNPVAPGAQEEVVETTVVSELMLARQEGRAPDLEKLTSDELNAQADMVGVDYAKYKSEAGLRRAVQKAMDEVG